MWRLLKTSWLRLFNQPEVGRQIRATIRDKAIAVARRVSVVKDGVSWKGSCPVCFEATCGSSESDMRMILAVHLSLWHPDDVQLQWDIMQKKNEVLHLPSIVLGVGVAAALGALLAFASKNRVAHEVGRREPLFKSRQF